MNVGDIVEFLELRQHEGSSTLMFRHRRIVYEAYLDHPEEDVRRAFAHVFQPFVIPVNEVWLRLTAKPGKPAAWVHVDSSNTEQADCVF